MWFRRDNGTLINVEHIARIRETSCGRRHEASLVNGHYEDLNAGERKRLEESMQDDRWNDAPDGDGYYWVFNLKDRHVEPCEVAGNMVEMFRQGHPLSEFKDCLWMKILRPATMFLRKT